jgi:23S rRNA (pseudouridine1915-N3)-methyltransferase|tara:strand:+ start:6496 stop:6960 length:465 start_codon:yes stop_codon:yes gene_type:complete
VAVKLLVVGPTKEKYFKQSEEEYLKRLRKYCKLHYVVVNSSKNSSNRDECLAQEQNSILKNIAESDYVLLLDEHGTQYSSRSFSKKLNELLVNKSNLVFVIGGAFGFSDAISIRSDGKWSLSNLTFPHHMVRTVFLEQLYRGFTILNGEKYHND